MRKYNKLLNKDITELKTLHSKKDKTDFNKMKADIMKRHNISKATVYREMKKELPGSYKRPRYDPPIREVTAKEKELVSGMLFKQTPIEQIRTEMEKQTGESYSWDRIDKIRSVIENEKQVSKSKRKIEIIHNQTGGFEYESPHGEDMKVFIGKLLNVDKMDPRSYVSIPFKGHVLRMNHAYILRQLVSIANNAACKGRDIAAVSKENIRHLAAEQVRYLMQGKPHSPKDLFELYKIMNEIEPTAESNGSFELVVKAVQYYAPGTERMDIVFVANRISEELNDLNNEYLPDKKESKQADFQWASDHM